MLASVWRQPVWSPHALGRQRRPRGFVRLSHRETLLGTTRGPNRSRIIVGLGSCPAVQQTSDGEHADSDLVGRGLLLPSCCPARSDVGRVRTRRRFMGTKPLFLRVVKVDPSVNPRLGDLLFIALASALPPAVWAGLCGSRRRLRSHSHALRIRLSRERLGLVPRSSGRDLNIHPSESGPSVRRTWPSLSWIIGAC